MEAKADKEPTKEEFEVLQIGAEYLALRNQAGYKRLLDSITAKCLECLDALQDSFKFPDHERLALLDRWSAWEEAFQFIQSEVNTGVKNATDLGAQLQQQGVNLFNPDTPKGE